MATCDQCGRPAWKPHGGMGGGITPDYETYCLQRNGQWCRVAREGAERERAAVVAWLRTTPRACGVLVDIGSSQDIARLAEDIKTGAHLDAKGG